MANDFNMEINSNKVETVSKCKGSCLKYVWQGQKHKADQNEETPQIPNGILIKVDNFCKNNKRLMSILIPALTVLFLWVVYGIKKNIWGLFVDNYFMSVTMVFGALFAGFTGQASAAIAFPVMTLVFNIPPPVARDVAVMIQSGGMSASTFTIFYMGVTVEYYSIICCSIGGIFGVIFGLEYVDEHIAPDQTKFAFVSIWFAYAFALFMLNCKVKNRKTFSRVPLMNAWKLGVFVITGFIGGMFTSLTASGMGITHFSVLTLMFRVSENTAAPTSVVLLAGSSIFTFFWRLVMQGNISKGAWEYFLVSIEIVVLFAPLGSLLGSFLNRLVCACVIYILAIVGFIGAYAIVPLTPSLIGLSVGLTVGGFLFFLVLMYVGSKLLNNINILEKVEEQRKNSAGILKETNGKSLPKIEVTTM
ncbi:unnamed protein product [Owenia fusiformis]|uniref:Uncharacterized protein n=1 Tax=Owenia fusiformis TaxID=6347 RepID=A0A8J1Y2G0_OWEFU|nr:unnamed protein product [Owenia fusiformis]